jgi:hypothetical protein
MLGSFNKPWQEGACAPSCQGYDLLINSLFRSTDMPQGTRDPYTGIQQRNYRSDCSLQSAAASYKPSSFVVS